MTKRIENTRVGKMLFDIPVFGGSSRAIEESEAEGQRQLVVSESIPTEMQEELKEVLEAAGAILGEPYKDDPLFLPVQLPEGWKKRPTDHNMWSELVDEAGEVVADIFYKAAFYDRRASINLRRKDN